MRPASFQNPVAVDGSAFERTRYALNPRMSYYAPEPGSVSPFGGYYAADPMPAPGVVVVESGGRCRCRSRDEVCRCGGRGDPRFHRSSDVYGSGPTSDRALASRERELEEELRRTRSMRLMTTTRRAWQEEEDRPRRVACGGCRSGRCRCFDYGRLPERAWYSDGYGRESRRYPGTVRHRYKTDTWELTGRPYREGDGRATSSWEWLGRSVRTTSAPGAPRDDVPEYVGVDHAPGVPEAKDEKTPRDTPRTVAADRIADACEAATSKLEKLVAAANDRAYRAETAANSRVDALAAQLEAQRREIEYLTSHQHPDVAASRAYAEEAADDEVLEAFDALRRENSELRKLLGAPSREAPAPALGL